VLCAGPERVGSTIREALAKGADRAIHLEGEFTAADPLGTAKLMAKALENERPDLVLTGLQSDDLGFGQTGVILAELMGVPSATIVMSVEIDGASLKIKRELENGFFQNVEMPLPALLTMQSGSNRLRYATLMGIKKAKTKEVRKVSASELGGVPASVVNIEKLYIPERSKTSQIFEGAAKEAAAKLVEKLKFEARVI
jgi:electron transfer flavoprotein beta subunit